MKRVYKQKLAVCDEQDIFLPKGSKALHIDIQKEDVCMWFECDDEAQMERRKILCIGTGYRVPSQEAEYIGTVLLYGGSLVYHFYMEANQ